MAQSKEMKDFQESEYQEWLGQNKEYLLRFLKENLSIWIDSESLGSNEYKHTISLCTDDGTFSYDTIYIQE